MDKKLENIINEISANRTLYYNQIPEIQLYMDQVTTFFDEKLKSSKRYKDDIILTKTMINNYTKSKILPTSNKKKYSEVHIMLLTLIYNMKSILSINDIAKLLSNINNDTLKKTFETFTNIQEEQYSNLLSNISKTLNNNKKLIDNNATNNEQLLILIFFLIIDSSNQKLLAEKIIDEYFTNN